jgi:uncharacterized protein YycO
LSLRIFQKLKTLPMSKYAHYLLYIAVLLLGVRMLSSNPVNKNQQDKILHEGDIIFQTSKSGQSLAIQLATHSKFSHCGILFKDSTGWYVLEAVQPVKKTSLKEWISHGDEGHYWVRRLKTASETLTPQVLSAMKQIGSTFTGKNYDLYFGWSDERIYCSELVWKIYKRAANLEVGKLQKLKEFDLTSPAVQKKMKERYGNEVPMEELVISPGKIYDSDLLVTVLEK